MENLQVFKKCRRLKNDEFICISIDIIDFTDYTDKNNIDFNCFLILGKTNGNILIARYDNDNDNDIDIENNKDNNIANSLYKEKSNYIKNCFFYLNNLFFHL
jgi:hypothetical protein